jgi:hypothetical protein
MTQRKRLQLTIRLIQVLLQHPLQLYRPHSMSLLRWMQMQPRKPLLHMLRNTSLPNMFCHQLPR